MKKITLLLSILYLLGCSNESNRKFIPTKYSIDSKNYTLRQLTKSPINNEFIAIFYDESRSLSGNKLLKLYSADSISIDELYYGTHPMEIINWQDSTILLTACVYDAHGDSAYRKWYLDNSVDKNIKIGRYKLTYKKKL